MGYYTNKQKAILKIKDLNDKIDTLNYRSLISKDLTKGYEFYSFAANKENKPFINLYTNQILDKCLLEQNYEYNDFLRKEIENLKHCEIKEAINELHFEIMMYVFLNIIYNHNPNMQGELEIKTSRFEFYRALAYRLTKETLSANNMESIFDNKNKNPIYYRGQSNIDWKMTSSMFRNLNRNILINPSAIEYLCKRFNKKYDLIFNYASSRRNMYDLLSFQQHAIAYSPLIDITRNGIIATSFALGNVSSINEFYGKDAVVIQMSLDDRKRLSNKANINSYLNNIHIYNLDIDSFMFGCKYNASRLDASGYPIRDEEITFSTFSEIIDHLTPNVAIYDVKRNDRMLYQQGSFLYLYGEKLVAFKGIIHYELNPYLNLKYIRIPVKNKESILKAIHDKYPYYDVTHLMNPYLYFSE